MVNYKEFTTADQEVVLAYSTTQKRHINVSFLRCREAPKALS